MRALDNIVREPVELNLDLMLLRGLYLFAAFITVAFFFQRFRWQRRKRKGKSNWGFYPSSASMGNALQQLSVIAQPRAAYVLEEKTKDDVEEDDEGGPEDPTAHLHWQAVKIQRGEKIDRLTAKLRRDR